MGCHQDWDPFFLDLILNFLGNLLVISSGSKSIKTEIEILKSPSVLIDIFEFVKTKKIIKENSNNNIRFMDWRENLNFSLRKRIHQYLSISYVVKRKNLLFQYLNKISKKYQQYSGKKN